MHKIVNVIITAMIAITVILLVISYSFSDSGLPYNTEDELYLFEEGWQFSTDGRNYYECNSPTELNGMATDLLVLKNKIPLDVDETFDTMQINLSRAFIRVFLRGELVYEINSDNLAPFGSSAGNLVLFIDLPDVKAGDEVVIKFEPVYEIAEIDNIRLGTQSIGIYDMLDREIINFVISAIITVFGLTIILFYIFVGRKNGADYLLHLGFFTLLAGLYTLTVLPMLVLFLSEPYIVSVASYLLLSLLPIPLLFYFCTAYELKYKLHLYLLLIVHSIYWITIIILQAYSIVDVREPIALYHVLLGMSLFFVVATAIYEIFKQKNKRIKTFVYSGVSLCSFAGIDLLTYYFANEYYMSTFFKIGVFSFSLILFVSYMSDLAEIIKENARTKLYERMAYEDILTSAKNRACYERDLEIYKGDVNQVSSLVLGIFDLNGLKRVNDTLGHKQGDELILCAATTLKSTFSESGDIYRVGGDEFIFLSTKISSDKIPFLMSELDANVIKNNSNSELELSIAGSLKQFDPTQDENIEDLFNRVDQEMYARKEEMKNNNK